MNEFLCHENGGKITKASRAKIESNSDPVSSGATLEHFPKNTVFVNKQMLWLMIREIKFEFGWVRLEELCYADSLWDCHAIFLVAQSSCPSRGRLRDKPKERLRRRLGLKLCVQWVNGTLRSPSLSSVTYFTSCYASSHNVFNVNCK